MAKNRKYWRHVLEAALAWMLLHVLRLLPLDMASALGGALGSIAGYFVRSSHYARQGLHKAFPEKTARERARILRAMWNHLGRVAAEFTHLPGRELLARTQIEGLEHLPPGGSQTLFFSGHFGNWEMLSSVASENGHPLALIYRHANNPFVDRMITRIRAAHSANLFAKGHRSASHLVRTLKGGESLAMLVDQKMNNGIAVPFFGHMVMTGPAIAQMALRFDLPIVPARVIRTHKAHFRATIYPPLVIEKTGNEQEDIYRILCMINRMLEDWIREAPEQWFWVHRRWPREEN